MDIDPRKVTSKDCYKLMVGSIVPRPIALVSTFSRDGVTNLAPFSYFTAISADPPTICFAPGWRVERGDRKDTLANIEATGEFVVNVVTEDMGAAMNETSRDYPPDVDEFQAAGLTPEPSRMIKPPRVKESPIHMECRLYDIVRVGRDKAAGSSLVIGEVVLFHVADHLYRDGRIDIRKLNPLGRLAGNDYTALGRIISHRRKPV